MVNGETPSNGPHNHGSGFVIDFILKQNLARAAAKYQLLACIASSISAIIISPLFNYSQARVFPAHRQ
jgi:hypothetical protein